MLSKAAGEELSRSCDALSRLGKPMENLKTREGVARSFGYSIFVFLSLSISLSFFLVRETHV